MKPWKSWLACLGVAGACLAWVGCGKSDTPDPDSDPNAATDSAPAEAGAGASVAQNTPAAEKTEPEAEAPAADDKEKKDAAASTAEASKGGSSTSEMLALSGNNAAEEGQAASGDAAAAQGGGQAQAGPGPGAGGGQQIGQAPPGAGGMPPGYPGGGPNPQGAMRPPGMAGAGAGGGPGMQAQMMRPGMAGAGGGGPNAQAAMLGRGGAGAGGGADEPADFHTQNGAVTAFLNAVKAKDAQRLREATALRAEKENEGNRNEKLFRSILDESISQDEMDELAKRLDGFQIAGRNVPKSTSRLGIILQRRDTRGNMFQRTITVRREKDGWKVCEISGEGRIGQSMGTATQRQGRR